MLSAETSALITVSLIFFAGIAFTLLPVIPGNVLIWLGILVHKIWVPAASPGWWFFWLATVLTLIALLADLMLGIWGARRFGASWRGAAGAIIGGIVGLFIPPQIIWLIVGPVAGAIIGELAAGRSLREGGRAGVGTILGGIVAFAAKFGLAITCVLGFYALLIAG